jgi:hypothetical protein
MESKTKLGDVFGKLTVSAEPFIKKQGKTSRFFTEVKCICGNKKIVSCSKLRAGNYKHCIDCSYEERSQKAPRVTQYQQMFKRLVLDRCKKKNIEVSITVDDYTKIIIQDCFYCNDTPRQTNRFANRKYVNTETIFANGIDRIDSSIGYTLNNCIPCCTSCNYAKHKLTQEEFFEKIKKIYKHLEL